MSPFSLLMWLPENLKLHTSSHYISVGQRQNLSREENLPPSLSRWRMVPVDIPDHEVDQE